jgi:hypothetical protein
LAGLIGKVVGALHYRGFFPLLILLPLLGVVAPRAGIAQQGSEGQIERSRLPNPLTPVTGGLSVGEPGGSDESPPPDAVAHDNDFGLLSLLRQPERPQPWSLFADGGYVYTSNVALTDRNTHGDSFFVGEGGVGYEWKISPDAAISASAQEQYFAYHRFNQLDFGSMDFALAFSYTAHRLDDIVLSTQLGFTRLTHRGLFDNEFFRNGALSFGAQKIFAIGRAQVISAGADIDLGLSIPHVAEREEFGLSTAYVVQVTRHLSIQAGVRVACFIYPVGGREDFNLSGTGGATYAFAPWCSLGVTLSGTVDRSNREVLAYDMLDSGASALFRFRF